MGKDNEQKYKNAAWPKWGLWQLSASLAAKSCLKSISFHNTVVSCGLRQSKMEWTEIIIIPSSSKVTLITSDLSFQNKSRCQKDWSPQRVQYNHTKNAVTELLSLAFCATDNILWIKLSDKFAAWKEFFFPPSEQPDMMLQEVFCTLRQECCSETMLPLLARRWNTTRKLEEKKQKSPLEIFILVN